MRNAKALADGLTSRGFTLVSGGGPFCPPAIDDATCLAPPSTAEHA